MAILLHPTAEEFITPPIGLFTIAGYLQERGYKVKIVNIGEKMLQNKNFRVKKFLEKCNVDIFGVDLHWCLHSYGALEIARICKEIHPSSFVFLGGLTATRFDIEIVKDHPFIDAVLRGEGEESTLTLVEKLVKGENSNLFGVKNLTFRDKCNKIVRNKPLKVVKNLDKFNFTNLTLHEPRDPLWMRTPTKNSENRVWSIPLCRGCLYNCVTCGGSKYSYRTLMYREKPAFRSPQKIIEDLESLAKKGVESVFLFQDPRMGGRKYFKELLSALSTEKPNVRQIGLELFSPANREFIREIASLDMRVHLSISPESASERVRRAQGRIYTNAALLKTARLCQQWGVPLGVFFMVGLAEQTEGTLKEGEKFWKKLINMNRGFPKTTPIATQTGVMVMLDPGSLAFDYPTKYGYRLLFKCFKDFYNGMSMPCWKNYINYETRFLKKRKLADLMLWATTRLNELYYSIGLYSRRRIKYENFKTEVNRFILKEVDSILGLSEKEAQGKQLRELKKATYRHEFRYELANFSFEDPIFRFTDWLRRMFSDPFRYKFSIRELWSKVSGYV